MGRAGGGGCGPRLISHEFLHTGVYGNQNLLCAGGGKLYGFSGESGIVQSGTSGKMPSFVVWDGAGWEKKSVSQMNIYKIKKEGRVMRPSFFVSFISPLSLSPDGPGRD